MQASLGAGNERGCRNLRYDAELIDRDSGWCKCINIGHLSGSSIYMVP